MEADKYRYVCEELVKRFPNLKTVAITLRGSISASHNTWSGVLWDGASSMPRRRSTSRTSSTAWAAAMLFMGGLIYGLLKYGDDKQTALNFAVAASCLKHTILGDFNLVTVGEVEKLMGGDASGRVSR